MTRLKVIAAVLTPLGILTAGAGLLAQQARIGNADHQVVLPFPSAPKGNDAIAPAIKALIDARIATAREIVQSQMQRAESSVAAPADDTAEWSRRWMDQELRLRIDPAARLAAIADHLERTRRLEQIAQNLAGSGQLRHADELKAKYYRLEAEQMLSEVRATDGNNPNPAPASNAVGATVPTPGH